MEDRPNRTLVKGFAVVNVSPSAEIEAYDHLPPELRKAVREFPFAISAKALKTAIDEKPWVSSAQWANYVNMTAKQFIDKSNAERGI